MSMSDEKLDLIADNEKEWRKYMLRKVDKLEENFNLFKIRAFGFITVLVALTEIAAKFLIKK